MNVNANAWHPQSWMRLWSMSLILSLAILVSACGDDDDDASTANGGDNAGEETGDGGDGGNSGNGGDGTFDATALLDNVATNVNTAIYASLEAEAMELQAEVNELVRAIDNGTEQSELETRLTDARAVWVAMRDPWERSEAFLFGPVADRGIDPRLDSWPVNETDLNNVLQQSDPGDFTPGFIDGLDNNVRGYHTVEFLLWNDGGGTGQDTVSDVVTALTDQPDRVAYLQAVTDDVVETTTELHDAWRSDGENFARTLSSAGAADNTRFQSQSAGLEEVIQGIIIIADEVGAGKLSDPFNQEDQLIVESKFSFNSREDFMDNIRGIQSVYLGDFGGNDGVGVTDFVQAVGSAALDTDIRTQIQAAIDRIEAIDQPFRDSIVGTETQKQEVRNSIDAVLELRDIFEQEVLPLLDQTTFAD